MPKKQILLKNSTLKSLIMFLEEMHDVVDSSERKDLEELIENLKSSQEHYTTIQLLDMLSKCVQLIPAVIQLIDFISRK